MEGSCEYTAYAGADGRRGGPPAWGLGEALTTPHRKKTARYEMLHRDSELAQYRDQWRALLNTAMDFRVP
jgi:hypothetical protein